MEDTILKVENLSHRYSIQWAVREISFELPGKGTYGLLGSNGAGKSTLMNIICGVIKQTEGEVRIKGIDTRLHPIAAKRLLGFLPQQPPVHGDLTIEEYLTHCARIRWIKENRIKPAVGEVMEKCAISHFRKRIIKNLSGGYQQRVGIAQAIIHEPELVVLDEPTNGLDPNQILEIRSLIREISQEHTVILSTHILSEIQAVCDEILMIEQGKLVFKGTVDAFDNYMIPNTLFLALAHPPSGETLAAIEGVVKAEELGGGKFRLHFTEAQEVIDRIVDLSSREQWHLSEIRVEKSSLDSVFAELSKKNPL